MAARVACVILAGGEGTRLFPLTKARAKPAVGFGPNYRLIDIPISNALHAGIQEIIVLGQYGAAPLQSHIEQVFPYARTCPSRVSVVLSSPQAPFLGTADAVRKIIHYLCTLDVDYYLILSGDQLYTMDLGAFIDWGRSREEPLSIATRKVGLPEATRMGLLKMDGQSRIVDFIEKPQDPQILRAYSLPEGGWLASMGIYLFERSAMLRLLSWHGDDFGKDLIPQQIQKCRASAYIFDGYWEDIGTIESFYAANLALLSGKNCLNLYDHRCPIFSHDLNLPSPWIRGTKIENSLLGSGSFIEGSLIKSSVIGAQTTVGADATISESVVLGRSKVGPGCVLHRVICDEGVTLGQRVSLTNQKGLANFDGHGIHIRSGIVVVPSGTVVPDGFAL